MPLSIAELEESGRVQVVIRDEYPYDGTIGAHLLDVSHPKEWCDVVRPRFSKFPVVEVGSRDEGWYILDEDTSAHFYIRT